MYKYILLFHVLAATVWTGGHLVLVFAVLPKALAERSAEYLLRFEAGYERIGIPALLIQVVTGFMLAWRYLPDPAAWFALDTLVSQLIALKILLLAITFGLALDARLRIIPKLQPGDDLKPLAYHIVPVTIVSVLFVVVGVAFRVGGFP